MESKQQALAHIPLTERLKLKEAIQHNKIFNRKFLRGDPWPKQQVIMDAIERPRSRTAVKACHSSGKTWVAASTGLWFLARFQEAIVITTAPTDNQVTKIMWPEIHTLVGKSQYPYPKALTTELKISPKRYMFGFTTSLQNHDEGVKFQGFHAEHILFILDEAPGVDPRIWAAIEGARAGGDVRILALGNPTISGGIFFDAFQKNRETWNTFTISAFDTPNLSGCSLKYIDPTTGDTIVHGSGKDLMDMDEEELSVNPRPYLTTRQWVREKFLEWGPDSPLFESRVLGDFPSHNEYNLVPLALVEACNRVAAVVRDDEDFHAGIDVAGPGDAETVLNVRQGNHLVLTKGYPQQDPRGAIVAELRPFQETGRLKNVNVDTIGIGYNFALHLSDLGFNVTKVNVQESVDTEEDAKRFYDKKAQYFWNIRELFQSKAISGVTDERTISQLTSIRYRPNSKGKIEIESKDDLRKRGVKSPDRAEALMLCYAPCNTGWEGLKDWYRSNTTVQTNSPRIGDAVLRMSA